MNRLDGRRVLVVGASSGIGRGIAATLSVEGASIAVAARRFDRLDELVAGCPSKAIGIRCDVTDATACEEVVQRAVEALGGLDGLIYAAGTADFGEVRDASHAEWRNTLDTNLIGFALVTAAALPHLAASQGHMVYLSSISARFNSPWRGLGLYIASKTAAESVMRSFRLEAPEVAFTTIVVGSTLSEFGLGADLDRYATEWFAKEQTSADILEPEDHADALVAMLTAQPRTLISEIVIEPRRISATAPPG